jgi:hypothetical protein
MSPIVEEVQEGGRLLARQNNRTAKLNPYFNT